VERINCIITASLKLFKNYIVMIMKEESKFFPVFQGEEATD